MLQRANLMISGLIFVWYLFAAVSGWKSSALTGSPAFSRHVAGGGHGPTFLGGWGGGK